MNKKRNLLYLLFTLLSLSQYFIKMTDARYLKDGVWHILPRINGDVVFNFRNSVSTAYFWDNKITTIILILMYLISVYNILKYNRFKPLLLMSYYCLFFIGQGYLWFTIKPYRMIFEPYNYWLYGISIFGFLAVTYLYFVVDKKVFKQHVAWVKEQFKMTS